MEYAHGDSQQIGDLILLFIKYLLSTHILGSLVKGDLRLLRQCPGPWSGGSAGRGPSHECGEVGLLISPASALPATAGSTQPHTASPSSPASGMCRL